MRKVRTRSQLGRVRVALTFMVIVGGFLSLAGAYGLSQGWSPGSGPASSSGVTKALNAIVTSCQDGNATACQELEAAAVASEGDIAGAVRLIEAAAAQDPVYAAQCHQVAHYIGRVAYYQTGINEALATMPGVCRGGILHGAQEEWSDDKSLQEISQQAPRLCEELERLGSGASDTCHHGIGHVLEYEHGHWRPAARDCITTLGNNGGGACLAGAVMSWVDKNNWEGTLGNPASQEPLLNGCLDFSGPGFYACGQSAGYAMMHASQWDAKAAAEGCALAANDALAGECAVGLGLEVGYLEVADPMRAVTTCQSLPQGNLHDPCLAGAALRVIQNVMDAKLASKICQEGAGTGKFCRRILNDAASISGSMSQLEDRGSA